MNDSKINGFNDATKHGHMVLEEKNNKDLRGNIFLSPRN